MRARPPSLHVQPARRPEAARPRHRRDAPRPRRRHPEDRGHRTRGAPAAELASGDDRIELLGDVGDSELVDLYAGALAVPFVPLDEDLGLVTLEAMASGKPVVTTFDAGGPTELVVDGLTGYVVRPDARSIGHALSRLVRYRDLAERLGSRGREHAGRVTWKRLVTKLLPDSPRRPARHRPGRRKLVVTSTFPVHPPRNGGQLRCHHLYRALTDAFELEIVSLGASDHAPSRSVIEPGLTETVVPKTPEHQQREWAIESRVGTPVTDVVAAPLMGSTPVYTETLRRALDDAHLVLLAHPFLHPLVREARPDLPFVYDAFNAEFVLKDSVFPDEGPGRELRQLVRVLEGDAVRQARLVTACSEVDASLLRSEYGREDVVEIPNGVDAGATGFAPGRRRAGSSRRWRESFTRLENAPVEIEHLALFLGSWHPPNLDAAEHLFDLAAELPEVGFVLAGSVCLQYGGRRLPPNVSLVGVVSDETKAALLEAADVALNPMTRGSGTNLKMVEYFAAGVPVVSTPVGVRGLDAEHGRHLLVAELDETPRAMHSLFDDPLLATNLAWRARHLAESRYDWRVHGARLLAAIETALEGADPQGTAP
ncbi:MAG: glycosyltransferase family 4 protein [Acidimicrobiia bacterium]|nr:glycosyltransferase family 4 protein [Acidimicrobiia bacterium]